MSHLQHGSIVACSPTPTICRALQGLILAVLGAADGLCGLSVGSESCGWLAREQLLRAEQGNVESHGPGKTAGKGARHWPWAGVWDLKFRTPPGSSGDQVLVNGDTLT